MPLSEELGVTSHGQQGCDSVLDLPIKKRRFLMVRSPSPPSRVSSSLTIEPGGPQNEQSISESESTWMPVSRAAKAYCLEKGGYFSGRDVTSLTNNDNPCRLSLQHSDVPIMVNAGEEISSEKKLVKGKKSAFQRNPEKMELLLALNKPFIGGSFLTGDQSSCQKISANCESMLALVQPFPLSIGGQNGGKSYQDEEKSSQYPQMLDESCSNIFYVELKNLASIEGVHNIQSESSSTESNSNCTHLFANRLKWDLNTVMDTSEGSLSSSAVNQIADGNRGFNSESICDKNPAISLVGTQTHLNSANCALLGSKDNASLSCPLVPQEDYDSWARLHMQIKPASGYLQCFSQGAANKSNSVSRVSNLNLAENLMPAHHIKLVDFKCVKSEPFDGESRVANKKQEVCNANLVNQRISNYEPCDGDGQETLHSSNLKFKVATAVKPEPLDNGMQENAEELEGMSCRSEQNTCTLGLSVCGEVVQKGVQVMEKLVLVSKSGGPNHNECVLTDQVEDIEQMNTSEGANTKASKFICTDVQSVDYCMNNQVCEGYENNNIHKIAGTKKEDPENCDCESDVLLNAKCLRNMVDKQTEYGNDYEDGEVKDLLVHNTSEGVIAAGQVDHVDCRHSYNNKADCADGLGDHCVKIASYIQGNCKTDNRGEKTNAYCDEEHSSALIEKKGKGKCTGPCLLESSATEVPSAVSVKRRPVKAIQKPRNYVGMKGELKCLETVSSEVVSASRETVKDDGQGDIVSQKESVKVSNPAEAGHSNFRKRLPAAAGEEAIRDAYGRSNRSRIINLSRVHDESLFGRAGSFSGRSMQPQAEKERFCDQADALHRQGSRDECCMDGFRKFKRERNQNQPIGISKADFMHGKQKIEKSLDVLSSGWDSDWDHASKQYSKSTDFQLHRHRKAATFAAMMDEKDGHFVAPDGGRISAARAWQKPSSDDMQSFHHQPSRRQLPGKRGFLPLDLQTACRPLREINPATFVGGGDTEMVLLRQHGEREGPVPDDMLMIPRHMRKVGQDSCIGGERADTVVFRQPRMRDGPAPLGMLVHGRPMRDISPDRYISGDHHDVVIRQQSRRREGPMPHVLKMAYRPLRNIGPDRCISGGCPNMVVCKHQEKFVRGLPDMMDSSFPRPQPQRMQNPFVCRERSLSPIQMRGPLHDPPIGSKSPPTSNAFSPDVHSELMHRRPSRILRLERMRVPLAHPCTAEDMMVRRHGSPTRFSNSIREVGSSREHELPRLIVRRSPSGRVLHRIIRRLDMIDPLEGTESVEHFGPLHPERLCEFVGDEHLDERHNFCGRHGLFHSYRPHDVGVDKDGLVCHMEHRSSPCRNFHEDVSEFHERGAARDMNVSIKYRLGNPTRQRNIEEQEDDYGHGARVCHDHNYDIVRLRRRRRLQ